MALFSRRVILDIGGSGIRLGEVLPDRKGGLVFRHLQKLDLGIDTSKAAEFFPAVIQQLDGFVRLSGIKPGVTSLCLSGPSVFTRVIKVPQTDAKQVKQMVGYEAQQAVPALQEACWDFQLFSAGGGAELEAMILAIKKDSVEEMVAAAAKAGLAVDCVDLAPAAIINAFRYQYPEITTSTLLLEIGARSTNIVIVEGSKIFCRIVPLGGASVTQAIATDLQESFAGAETLKKAKGFVHPGGSYEDPPDEIGARISKLSRGVVTRLHTEVERSITFYRSQQGGSRPAQVFLAGGGAELGLIDFFFKEKLKIPVRFFQSFRRTGTEGALPVEVQKDFPAWACFVGTAVRSLPEAPCRINMMTQLQNPSLPRGSLAGLRAVVGAAGLLLLLPGIHGFWQGAKIEAVVSPQKDKIERVETLVSNLEAKTKQFNDLMGRLDAATRLEEERLRWPLLLEELAKKCLPGMWITRVTLVAGSEGTSDPNPSSMPANDAQQVPLVELSGIFETKSEEIDAQVIDLFCKSLEEGNILQKMVTVERETPERSADGKTEQVALKFTLRGEWKGYVAKDEKAGNKAKKK